MINWIRNIKFDLRNPKHLLIAMLFFINYQILVKTGTITPGRGPHIHKKKELIESSLWMFKTFVK